MSIPVLNVNNLTKIFRPWRRRFFLGSKSSVFTAVNQVSFELKEGEILGILGPNGAGKTTIIEMLLGILRPTSGSISYFGQDFLKYTNLILQRISFASSYHKMPGSLTIQENLEIFGRLYGLHLWEIRKRIDLLLHTFGLETLRTKQAGALSAGQMTRAMLAKAFLPEPNIVLLDEPTASLDPDIAVEARRFIVQQQKERKVSIILTSHNMKEVVEICDRALVLQHGKIIEEDTPEELGKSVALTELFLLIHTNVEKAIQEIKLLGWHCQVVDGYLKIEIDEKQIPFLLKELAHKHIDYSHIEIKNPSLEDYFLYIARNKGNNL